MKKWIAFLVLSLLLFFLASCQSMGPNDKTSIGALMAEPMKTEPWKFGDTPGLIMHSDHYRVFTTVRDPVFQHLITRVLEAAYSQSQLLNAGTTVSPPGGAFDCYVFGDRPQWETYTKLRTGANSSVYLQISSGGYCQEGVLAGYDIGREMTLSVLAHEAWHQYSWFAFKDRLPSWLEEGIATQNEAIDWDGAVPSFNPEHNFHRFQALQSAVKEHRLWALRDLTATHAGKVVNLAQKHVDSYYAQVWAMTLFLEHSKEYRPKLIEMLKGAREGKLSASLAGTAATPFDIQHFTEAWNTVAGPRYLAAFIEPDLFTMEKKYNAFMSQISAGWPMNLP